MSLDAYVIAQVLYTGSSLKVAVYEELAEALTRFSDHLDDPSLFYGREFDHLIIAKLPVEFSQRYDSWNILNSLDTLVCRVDNARVVDRSTTVARRYQLSDPARSVVNSFI